MPEEYQVSVEVTVSADVPGYEGLYLWQYHVTSGTDIPPGLPLYFDLLFGAGEDVANVTGPEGWMGSVSAGSGVFWEGTSGSGPAPSGDFSFTTDPRPVVLINAEAGVTGFAELTGGVYGPGTAPENHPPEVVDPGNLQFLVGDEVYLPIEAWDPDGDSLSFVAENLPPGLSIDEYTGVISGTVEDPEFDEVFDYPVVITVTDGRGASSSVNPFFQVVANVNVTNVTLTGPPGVTPPITLLANGSPTNFQFTVTATGPANTTVNLLWSVIETDTGTAVPDDELLKERSLSIPLGAAGTGSVTKTFQLFSARNGAVMGADEWSFEDDPDPIYVLIESPWFRNLGTSNTLKVKGQTIGSIPGTVGTVTGARIDLTGPATAATAQLLDQDSGLASRFDFTITVTGAAGTLIQNLVWSVNEEDSGPDNEIQYERNFDVQIGADGTGTFSGSFYLFSDRTGVVRGIDDHTNEIRPDGIYVQLEYAGGTDIVDSNRIFVKGRI